MTLETPVQNILVHPAECFRVRDGVNLNDALSVMEDLVPDDVYELDENPPLERLALDLQGERGMRVADGSEAGTPGARLHLDCALTLMSPDGATRDAIVLVEVDAADHIAQVFLLPLAPLEARVAYRLVNMERRAARKSFAQVACLSFSRGTRITMATGEQMRIEHLNVGDRVLTRDAGAQAVRWIGQTTVRAEGDFAPIVITAGTLNNAGDLIVSPDHRLFVYQRSDQIGAGRAELLVRARHLVNGSSVYVMKGGFVDYYQVLFDRHHLIYAEGIAAESLLVEPRTRPALPPDLLEKISTLLPRHGSKRLRGMDVQRALLDRPDAIDLLRRASAR